MNSALFFIPPFLLLTLLQSAALFPAFVHPLRPDFTALFAVYGAISRRGYARFWWFFALTVSFFSAWSPDASAFFQLAAYTGIALVLGRILEKLSRNSYLLDAASVFLAVFLLQTLSLKVSLLVHDEHLSFSPLLILTLSHALSTALCAFFLFPLLDHTLSQGDRASP